MMQKQVKRNLKMRQLQIFGIVQHLSFSDNKNKV